MARRRRAGVLNRGSEVYSVSVDASLRVHRRRPCDGCVRRTPMPLCTCRYTGEVAISRVTRTRSSWVKAFGMVMLVLGLALPAAAEPVTYQLFVAATTGPLLGQTSTGIVTFDS